MKRGLRSLRGKEGEESESRQMNDEATRKSVSQPVTRRRDGEYVTREKKRGRRSSAQSVRAIFHAEITLMNTHELGHRDGGRGKLSVRLCGEEAGSGLMLMAFEFFGRFLIAYECGSDQNIQNRRRTALKFEVT